MTRTVVFVHGAWVTPLCWEHFQQRYEERGYHCIAPAWPGDERTVEELRGAPVPGFAHVGVAEIVHHYEAIVAALPEPPVLIGHSFGGLFVQMLLDRGLGAAGVAIDPAPPRGVLPGPTAFRSSFFVLTTWRAWKKVLTMPFEAFRSGFVNTLPDDEQRALYERYVVPTPGRVFLQDALGSGTRVDFRRADRAPLLMIAGGSDNTVEPSMVRRSHDRYAASPARTDFFEFADRPHLLIATPGWEQVADHAIEWVEARLGD